MSDPGDGARRRGSSSRSDIQNDPNAASSHEFIVHRKSSMGLKNVDSAVSGNSVGLGMVSVKSLYSVASALNTKVGIGLLGCICVIVGCVLGSGIFAAPQEILNLTGSPALTLLVWFTYGIIALIAALCYVELGCTFPVSGGDYAYLNECFGSCPAFLFQWSSNCVVTPVTSAIMSSVVAKNLVNPYVCDPDDPHAQWATSLLAISLIMIFSYINCVSTKLTEKVEGYLMIINIITISLVVSCGIAYMAQNGVFKHTDFKLTLPQPDNKTHLEGGPLAKFQVLQIVKALYQSSFSYFGYTYLNYMTEELENPIRNLPLGICISIPIIIFLNVFVNFCYLATLSESQIRGTQTIASDMFRAILPLNLVTPLSWLAPTLVAVAVSGGLTSNIMTCSRISFTGARNFHMPRVFATVHYTRTTPVVSISWLGFVASFFVLVGKIPTLIGIATYLESSFNCLCIYGLIYMRIKKPNLPRPIKIPIIIPIIYCIIATFLVFVPIFTIDETSVKETLPSIAGALFVVFFGIPIYFLLVRKTRNWSCLHKIDQRVTLIAQKLWMVIPEETVLEIGSAFVIADGNSNNYPTVAKSSSAVFT